jgi:hypothetical protein
MTKPRDVLTDSPGEALRQWRFTLWNNDSQKTSGVAGSVDTITYDCVDFSDIENESPSDPWLWRRADFGLANSIIRLANINSTSPMIFDPKTADWGDVNNVRIHTRVKTSPAHDPTWLLFARIPLYPVPHIDPNQTFQIQDLIVRFFGGFPYAALASSLIDIVTGDTVTQSLANTLTDGTVYWMSLHDDVGAELNYTGYARQPVKLWQYDSKVYLQTSVTFPQINIADNGYAKPYFVRINTNSTSGNTTVPGGNTGDVTFQVTAASYGTYNTGDVPYVDQVGSGVRIV